MNKLNKQQLWGWIAVGLSTLLSSFWAFWGAIENFHEGWFHESLWANLGLMFLQYLSPMLLFMGISLLSVFYPKIGAGLHWAAALLAIFFFNAFSNAATFFIILPLIGLGFLYWFGKPVPRKYAVLTAACIPLLVMLVCGFPPAVRVSQRLNDGNLNARLVEGNGVSLTWAPAGPGWPSVGKNWESARDICAHLNEAGLSLEEEKQDIWRLPTVDETVRSMSLHGLNSGGVWDEETETAVYKQTPDKESPLWNVHSQVIYWWTATEIDAERSWMVAYDGQAWPRQKIFGPAYLGFRCVK